MIILWAVGLALSAAACTARPLVTMPIAATAPAPAPAMTPISATVTAAVGLLPTPTPGPLYISSGRGGYRLRLPPPWQAGAPARAALDPTALGALPADALELVAYRADAGMSGALTIALLPAHGLTLDQWRAATAAALVIAGFDMHESSLIEAGGDARIPVARLIYQLLRSPGAAPASGQASGQTPTLPQMGMQLAWFAPDDQLAVMTLVSDAANFATLGDDVAGMLATLVSTEAGGHVTLPSLPIPSTPLP
jgi:hypothetical protein